MESRHYLLPTDARPRLELVCGTHWRYLHVVLDDTQIGTVSSAGQLLRGAEFFLPDGGVLSVRLIKEVGRSDLHVTLNGRVLNSTALDRHNKDVRMGYQAVLAIGAVNLIFFCLTLLVRPSSTDLRWYDLAFGVAFLFLGWMVREGSGTALTFALVIYLADTAITLIAILSYRYYVAIVDLSINFVLLFFMLQGYGGLHKALANFRWFGRMLRDTPEKPVQTALSSGMDQANPLPANLKQIQGQLRDAVQMYAHEPQRERARTLVKKQLQVAPSLADGWYTLAYMTERPADRLKLLERVLAIDPFHAGAQHELDRTRRGSEFVDRLLTADVAMIGIAPQDLLKQAAADLKRGDKPAATTAIRQALTLDAQNADAWFLASFLSQVPEERRQALEQAVKYNPTHAVAQQALERVNAADDSFSDLRASTWLPDMSDVLRQQQSPMQVAAASSKQSRDMFLIRTLVGLLVIIGGLIFVVIILSP